LGGNLTPDDTFTDRTRLPPVGPLPERHRMPYRSLGDQFIGRIDAIWQLYDRLFQGGISVLWA
jgi:hypothetical protein